MALVTMREALNQALREEMLRDKDVFLMGEEVGEYRELIRLQKGCSKNSDLNGSSIHL